MAKTHKRHSRRRGKMGLLKKMKRSIPVMKSSLKKVGTTMKNVTKKATPIVNKGLESAYGTLASTFDMGVKGVGKVVAKMNKTKSRTRKHRKH